MKKTKIVCTIIALLAVIVLIGGVVYGYYRKTREKIVNPIVTIEVEKYGTIKIELYPEIAPNTVANFVTLANNGFYDGTIFHRVVKDFMVQGGGFTAQEVTDAETGKTKKESITKTATLGDLGVEGEKAEEQYCIKGEMSRNGNEANTLRHEEGVISMARADYTVYSSSLTEESYNSATSQFFIVTEASEYLDGNYTAFGKVIEGYDIVEKIEKVEVAENSQGEKSEPVEPVLIKSITVDTKGVQYEKPNTLEPFDFLSWYYGF